MGYSEDLVHGMKVYDEVWKGDQVCGMEYVEEVWLKGPVLGRKVRPGFH
jgi:hypothetical protein